MEFLGKGDGLIGIGHVGFSDHLNQRRAGSVQVDASHAMEILMERFAGILFQVGMVNAHPLGVAIGQVDIHIAGTDNRALQLCCLVALGQVRIEIVLPFKH